MPAVLSHNWWALALRGVAGIIFGLLTFLMPGVTLAVLVWWFGAYAIVDGIFAIIAAIRVPTGNSRWWALLIEGAAGVIAGVIAFTWTGVTAIVLVYLIGIWAFVTGIFEIVAAIRLRRAIAGEWLLILMGIVSVIFGVAIVAAPLAGALVLTIWIGAYALIFGIMAVILAFRVRSWMHRRTHGSEPVFGHS